jgi:thiamine biosynthesis protein ThiI
MNVESMEKAVYLVSGGIDSPVATYLGIMKGWKPIFVYFDNSPFAGEGTKRRAMETIARVEAVTGVKGKTVIVPHGRDLTLIVERCRRNFSCLLCKRMMYRKAGRIAKDEGCQGLVTGEILGEQASQTLRNLVLDSAVVEAPLVRPLLGMNKLEVEAIARRIGTFEISTSRAEPCSAAAVKARTRAKAEELEREEAKLPIQELVAAGLKDAVTIKH